MRAHRRIAPWLAAVVVAGSACTAAGPQESARPSFDAPAAAQALHERKHADATASKLPSGRTAYRTYAEVGGDLGELEAARPDVVERFALPHRTLLGLDVVGVEVAHDVAARDGKPVLLVTGAHEGVEWATVEVAVEFATDLAERDGRDPRITALLDRVRVVVVPVVNPDGFQLSRAGTVPDKRRNCRVADPAAESCATSPAAGVDLIRDYGGAAPFSEPETQNVRDLVGGRQVTVFGGLRSHAAVVRPPAADTADEAAYAAIARTLGADVRSAGTGGTAAEWVQHTTGGFAFDLGLSGQPRAPYPLGVVDQYLGTGSESTREVLTRAAEAAADRGLHSVLAGTTPTGAVLTLRRTATGQTAALRSTTTSPGRFEWDVNPATWTLDCARPDGTVLQTLPVAVARGERVEVDLSECAARWTE
jgi:hypothetical protein